MNLMGAIGQALDFLWKAAQNYAATEEGAKELNDVIVALEGTDNQPPNAESSVQSEPVASRYRR